VGRAIIAISKLFYSQIELKHDVHMFTFSVVATDFRDGVLGLKGAAEKQQPSHPTQQWLR
jgi:hypothetical protein